MDNNFQILLDKKTNEARELRPPQEEIFAIINIIFYLFCHQILIECDCKV